MLSFRLRQDLNRKWRLFKDKRIAIDKPGYLIIKSTSPLGEESKERELFLSCKSKVPLTLNVKVASLSAFSIYQRVIMVLSELMSSLQSVLPGGENVLLALTIVQKVTPITFLRKRFLELSQKKV